MKTSERIYRCLLRLYPRDFREEYGHEMSLLGVGTAIGLTGALIATRYFEAQFGVTATDSATFVGGCVVISIVGLAASVIPALRAMRVDPVIALRRA